MGDTYLSKISGVANSLTSLCKSCKLHVGQRILSQTLDSNAVVMAWERHISQQSVAACSQSSVGFRTGKSALHFFSRQTWHSIVPGRVVAGPAGLSLDSVRGATCARGSAWHSPGAGIYPAGTTWTGFCVPAIPLAHNCICICTGTAGARASGKRSWRSARRLFAFAIQTGAPKMVQYMPLKRKKTRAHAPAAAPSTRAAKARTAAATTTHVAIAKGMPTTVMHIHLRTIASVCQEWIKPAHWGVGILNLALRGLSWGRSSRGCEWGSTQSLANVCADTSRFLRR
jgi:hypothetical protein